MVREQRACRSLVEALGCVDWVARVAVVQLAVVRAPCTSYKYVLGLCHVLSQRWSLPMDAGCDGRGSTRP